MNRQFFTVAAALGLSAAAAALGQSAPQPAKVTAWAQHHGGNFVYSYIVENLSDQPIRRFLIGENYEPQADVGGPQLTVRPRLPGLSHWLPAEVTKSPPGWGAAVAFEEENPKFSIEWIEAAYFRQISPAASADEGPAVVPGAEGILPGTAVSAFAISLPKADYAYANGHAAVYVGDSLSSVPIVKGDSAPPTITLTVERVNQNEARGAWALFNVRYAVSDNYDPGPVAAFEPIAANQPVASGDIVTEKNNSNAWNVKLRNVPGRIYTFSVRAFDASGNMALKQYQYSVAR